MRNNTKRKLPIFDILLTSLTLILILASAYLLYLYKSNSIAAHDDPDDLNAVSSTIDEADSSFSGIKIITEISNDVKIPFAIQYPKSNHTAFNDKIKKHIKGIKHDHLTNVATYKQKHKNFTNELNISFETFEHPNGTYSFVFVSNKHIGDLQGEMEIHTFHLNNENGDMLTLENILDYDLENLQTLSTLTKKQLESNDSSQNRFTKEEIKKYTEPLWENYQHFAFTDEALVLYFPHDQTDDNIPIVSLPYEDVNDLFIDSYQVQLKDDTDHEESSTDSNGKQNDSSDSNQADETEVEENTEQEISSAKKVALTFDDGPDPNVTTRVLQTLEKYDAKATFFMLGSRVEYYPEIAKMVQEAGHELGNHSWTHPDLTKASSDKVHNEIHRTSQIIEDITGEKPYSFRPPYGAFNDGVKQQTDLPIALWDVDTLDWKHRSPQQLLSHVQNGVRDGSIILMHDIHPATADGLDAVMAYLQENGYTFVTVSEIEESQ